MMTRREVYLVLVWFALFLVALVCGQNLRTADARNAPTPQRIGVGDVLVVRHTYDGTIEFTGYLLDFRYGPDAVYVETTDDGDGIFRSAFEAAP